MNLKKHILNFRYSEKEVESIKKKNYNTENMFENLDRFGKITVGFFIK